MNNLYSIPPSRSLPLEEIYGDTQRVTIVFQWFLVVISLGLAAGIFISLTHGDSFQALLIALGFPPALVSYVLIRRGKFESASVFLAAVIVSLITLVATNGLGIHHISVAGYPAVLIVASIVTRRRSMILLTAYTLACAAWLVFGEALGFYKPAPLVSAVPGDFLSVATIVVSTTVMVRLISNALLHSHARYQKELEERESAEQALAFSEKKFYEAFNSSPVMMTIEGADHRFIDANPAFMRGIGYTREEVIGRRAAELQLLPTPRDVQTVQTLASNPTGQTSLEVQFRRKSGEIGVALMSADRFEVNGAAYELTSALDITDRKRIEAEREELIAELQAKNAELERFTYTVSHDLKAPIITIKGFLGFLERDLDEGDRGRVRDDVKRVNEAVDKMNRLLNELLELSRIGRMANPPESAPMADLAREALENVRGNLEAGRVAVNVEPGLPVVYGDRQRLVEVLQNLADNAAKFMGDQPRPRVEIGQRGEEDGKPVFFVRDNGIGIAPEYHERIFGLFNKLDPKSDGTGIGLAIVKRIVEAHGGRIWVESEAGRGCAFYFTLRPEPPERKP
ncbi:MAG: ATP-binding protein [Chloroflexota bacterium]